LANPGVTYEQWQEAEIAFDACHQNKAAAARSIGQHPETFRNRLERGRIRYGGEGGNKFGGSTTLRKYEYGESGDTVLEWTRTNPGLEKQVAAIKDVVREFAKPVTKIPKAPEKFDADIIPWFQIGDAHLGMLAHESETGSNFDLKIAERELCQAFATLIDECRPRERCCINDLGDFTHYENMKAETEASGHKMDADGRFPKMIGVYSRVMRFFVDRCLTRFQHVDVIINQGNHSRTNDIWMAELLRCAYASSERVHVLDNSGAFIPYRMGNTFVLTHHSDKARGERLVQVMANDYRQDWGDTEFHYIDVGHLHHKTRTNEDGGATIEMWNTLAPRDKYGNDGGWRAHQSITRVDRSMRYGEVGRRVLPIQEIRDSLKRGGVDGYCPPERRKVHTI
tara:strand:- start:1158 stop:2345 length:1188 start_codon:yes stop_codon:yes gene_type:complete